MGCIYCTCLHTHTLQNHKVIFVTFFGTKDTGKGPNPRDKYTRTQSSAARCSAAVLLQEILDTVLFLILQLVLDINAKVSKYGINYKILQSSSDLEVKPKEQHKK